MNTQKQKKLEFSVSLFQYLFNTQHPMIMCWNKEQDRWRKIETWCYSTFNKIFGKKTKIINGESEPVRKVVDPSLACWSFCERVCCDDDDRDDDRQKGDI